MRLRRMMIIASHWPALPSARLPGAAAANGTGLLPSQQSSKRRILFDDAQKRAQRSVSIGRLMGQFDLEGIGITFRAAA